MIQSFHLKCAFGNLSDKKDLKNSHHAMHDDYFFALQQMKKCMTLMKQSRNLLLKLFCKTH